MSFLLNKENQPTSIMKLQDLYETPSPSNRKYEWRKETQQMQTSAVLYQDYGKGFEYAAKFVHAREDGYEYYSATVHNAGDRIEFGGKYTQRKRFANRSEVNSYLKTIKLPELTNSQFDDIHPKDTIVVCIKGMGGMSVDHYMLFGPILVKFKNESKTEDEFMKKMLMKLHDMTKQWIGTVTSWDKITSASIAALKEYYASGKTNKF